MRAIAIAIAALFLATGAAHAELPKPRLWNCGSIVVINPNDPIWKQDKAVFFKYAAAYILEWSERSSAYP